MVKIYLNILRIFWEAKLKNSLCLPFCFLNITLANETLESKCNNGDVESYFDVAFESYNGKDYAKAFKYYEKACSVIMLKLVTI